MDVRLATLGRNGIRGDSQMAAEVDIDTLVREIKEVHEHHPTWTQDNAFVQWFLQAFLVSDPEMAARSVTGVSHDKGVDGIYIDESLGHVSVLQGKFRQRPKPPLESRSDVIAFAQLARKLTGPKRDFDAYLSGIDPSVGKVLTEGRQRIRRRHFELHLYYVTTGRCSAPLKSEAESELTQAGAIASISVMDRSDILSLLIDYLGGAAPPVPFLDLPIDSRGIVASDGVIQRYDQGSGIESWILSMSGRDLAGLFGKAGDRLFARNIRGFLGNTGINDGMRTTLSREADHFWYFNNGVTLICDSARKTAERGQAVIRVTNPQVINGQQTTRVLFSTPASQAKEAAVIVRVISVPRNSHGGQSRFEQLVSNIVAATNWQNAILASDLRANDARQIHLQRELAKLNYQYLRKRQTKKEAKRLLGHQHWFWIKKEELAQVVAAGEFDPFVVRSGKEGLFKQPYYDRIFDGRSIREYLSMYWVARIVKYKGSSYPDRAYAKWYAMHFLWHYASPLLRSKPIADHFRTSCERSRWPAPLQAAADQVYRSLMEFYKLKRGGGSHAIDISTFFYRLNQHMAFETFWRGGKNLRKARFRKLMKKFQSDMKAAIF
jgi:AIPR protein